MLTGMTERDWSIVLDVFAAAKSRRGEPGHDDRKFLEAVHYFTVHSITWRALPSEYGKWNSVWKRFWRLSRSGVFEAFFQMLAELSQTAHLVQLFDSTTARAHVSAAGAQATVLAVKRRFALPWSEMDRDASRLALRATAFGGFGLDPPRSMSAELLIGSTPSFTRIAMGFWSG